MFSTQAKQKIAEELARAAAARADGMEGRARVCARRAAGAAVREYLRLRGDETALGLNAYDLLALLQASSAAPQRARESAALLLRRVEEDYTLPSDIDLIEEARRLSEYLEQQGTG